MVSEFKKTEGIDLSKDPMGMQRLKEASEKAKVELSSTSSTEINLPYITADQTGPKHLVLTLTRAKFENLTSDLFKRLRQPCLNAIKDAGLTAAEINEVILVGGSSRIPMVQAIVKEIFGKEPNKSVNPDEVVAMGAAIQGGVLSGSVSDVLLLDVTPLSMGIETLGGVCTRLIERNTTIPTKKSETFSTAADNQTQVEIHILQGERQMATDNKSLGRFVLDGIPPAPRGTPQVEVTFDIDANGIMHVSAKDKASGKEQSIRIEASSGLTDAEKEAMINDAEKHADEDAKARELIDIRNKADAMVYQTEKNLAEYGEKVPGEMKAMLEEKVEALKSAQTSNDKAVIEKALNALTEIWNQASGSMYEAAKDDDVKGGTDSAASGNEKDADGEQVEEADFEVVDDADSKK